MKAAPKKFEKEKDLCAAFTAVVRSPAPRYAPRCDEWEVYAETGGFDLLLVRKCDGAQVGVEAKLRLNAKVVCQALPRWRWSRVDVGPDFRAVLVPYSAADTGLGEICAEIGITVLRMSETEPRFYPALPTSAEIDRYGGDPEWFEWAQEKRCPLPDYVPDVVGGDSAPRALTPWKVAAIKMAVLLETRAVCAADFKAFGLSPSRWTQSRWGWLTKTPEGWVPGPSMPNFKAQHPVNYEQIKADRESWESKMKTGALV